jgi:hypothetical protein
MFVLVPHMTSDQVLTEGIKQYPIAVPGQGKGCRYVEEQQRGREREHALAQGSYGSRMERAGGALAPGPRLTERISQPGQLTERISQPLAGLARHEAVPGREPVDCSVQSPLVSHPPRRTRWLTGQRPRARDTAHAPAP